MKLFPHFSQFLFVNTKHQFSNSKTDIYLTLINLLIIKKVKHVEHNINNNLFDRGN